MSRAVPGTPFDASGDGLNRPEIQSHDRSTFIRFLFERLKRSANDATGCAALCSEQPLLCLPVCQSFIRNAALQQSNEAVKRTRTHLLFRSAHASYKTMSLHRVGLCGVDDSVDPSLLSAIVSRWPRVELGVLFRPGKEGQPRFPTRRWLEQLAKTARNTSPPAQLAGHLCGSAVDDVLQRGDVAFVQTLVGLGFRRVQLNATAPNGCKTAEDPVKLEKSALHVRNACAAVPEVEFIVQANDSTEPLWRALLDEPPANLSLLWDASCGRGHTLDASLTPVETAIPQGFAGGLNRDNVATVLDQLRKGAARGRSIWIDMESGLRSDIDGSERFDVNRAWAVCAALDAIGWDDPDAPSPPIASYNLPPNATLIKHALAAHKVTVCAESNE